MRILIAALAALALSPAATAVPARPAATRDWSQVATRTPGGTFVLGNPAARVKLVETLSFTCPHCAVVEASIGKPLRDAYIRPGLVSLEVRIGLRDPFDLAAAVLARCNGPQGFFAVKPALYAAQEQWVTKGQQWAATSPKLDGLSEAQAGRAIAAGAGLDTFFLAHGLTRQRIDACLADADEQRALSIAAQQIWQPGFPGTPDFLVNGARVPGVRGWADLEPRIKAALR